MLTIHLQWSDGRLDEVAYQSAPEGDSAGVASTAVNIASQRSLQSHASSGLSESTDTLTDVSLCHNPFLLQSSS